MNSYPRQAYPFCISCISFFLLFVVGTAYGQFKDGYVVSVDGDTTKGLIRYLDWAISPEHIVFKSSENQSEVELTADQLSMFYITSTNERFVSKRIGILRIYSKDVYGEKPSLTPTLYRYVFLESILQGPEASLYKYVNEADDNHFFIETPVGFQELIHYTYYQSMSDDKLYQAVVSDYKVQLSSICSNAPVFNAALPFYSEVELKKYLTKYNACFLGETIVYKSANPKIKVGVGVSAGLENFSDQSGVPIVGARVRISFPKDYYRRFARVGLSIVPRYKYDGENHRLNFMSVGIGKYWGYKNFHPYIVVQHQFSFGNELTNKQHMLSANFGINYKKIIELEVGTWNNILAAFFKENFLNAPSITLHLYPQFFKKK